MKKTLLLCLFILAASTTILKAQFFLGGGLSVNTSNETIINDSDTEDGDKSFSFTFNPKAGYFITNKFGLGIALEIGSSKYTYSSGGDYKSTNWAVAPFVRFYFAKKGNFSFFGEGSLGVGGGKSPEKVYDIYGYYSYENVKYFDITFRISPGFSYDLTEKIALEAVLGGIKSNTSILEDDRIQSDWGLDVGLDDLSLGMIFKL